MELKIPGIWLGGKPPIRARRPDRERKRGPLLIRLRKTAQDALAVSRPGSSRRPTRIGLDIVVVEAPLSGPRASEILHVFNPARQKGLVIMFVDPSVGVIDNLSTPNNRNKMFLHTFSL